MTKLQDIRTAIADFGILTSNAPQLGPYVPKNHMRHILAVRFDTISGKPTGTSGASVAIYDTWGTSNNRIHGENFVTVSGNAPDWVSWPQSPRPDLPIGHVKESGVATVYTSGMGFTVTMIYTDRPGGVY